MEYTIERQTDIPLKFDGELLTEQSSQEPGATRWQEVRLYRTSTGRYVAEVVGETRMPNERVFRTVTVCDSPAEIRQALFRTKDGREYLNDLSLDALDEAGQKDQSIGELVAGERI